MSMIPNPQEPFAFINVFEIPVEEIDAFVEQWNERSIFMTGTPGFLGAKLHKALLSETRFQLINVAKFNSYTAFEEATANPAYATQLKSLLDTSKMIPNRGFYRPVALAAPYKE